jgi:hypothetical protein
MCVLTLRVNSNVKLGLIVGCKGQDKTMGGWKKKKHKVEIYIHEYRSMKAIRWALFVGSKICCFFFFLFLMGDQRFLHKR